jgi:mitochondrial FAD-linked sulfhydryl oxidase
MMNKNIWGPSGWLFMHSISFQYPENPNEEDKNNYRVFFESLKNTIPCPKCREHYSENLKQNPIQLNSRDELIQWVIDIHNEVNEKNSKKIYSRQEVEKLYLSKYNYSIEKNESIESNMNMLLIVILIVMVVFYFLKK